MDDGHPALGLANVIRRVLAAGLQPVGIRQYQNTSGSVASKSTSKAIFTAAQGEKFQGMRMIDELYAFFFISAPILLMPSAY